MALIVRGKTTCGICKKVLQEYEDVVSFPAFLPSAHDLSSFSDAAFHAVCLKGHPRGGDVERLYARYREIWDSRPTDLKTLEEVEAWGREAFKNFP